MNPFEIAAHLLALEPGEADTLRALLAHEKHQPPSKAPTAEAIRSLEAKGMVQRAGIGVTLTDLGRTVADAANR